MSVARASLIALYDFFEPAIVAQGMVIPEDGLGLALGAALLAYGVAATSSWLRDAATGIISTSAAALNVGSLPGAVPGGAASNSWYGHDANDAPATVGKALKCPPGLNLLICADSTFRLYAVHPDGSQNYASYRPGRVA